MISQFTVGMSRTFNLGNFESLRIEGSITVDLNEGESLADAKAQAQQDLRTLMEQTYKAQHADRKKAAV